ncbi:MAG: fatty acid desaturase [Myxococcales bacterium]|nr:fatty acid desaturase [Myxococcales bacterium]USN51187.1 MAG: fatty acid desaturase [Myxococcales bacterium]
MRENFYHSHKLDQQTLSEFKANDNALSYKRFFQQYLLFCLSAITILWPQDKASIIYWIAFFFVAIFSMSLFAITHETAHRTTFLQKKINDIVCFLVSVPIFYSPSLFRDFHAAHHRYTHKVLLDPEVTLLGKPVAQISSSWFMYLSFLTGLPLLLMKISMLIAAAIGRGSFIKNKFLPFINEKNWSRVKWEARFVILLHLGLIFTSDYYGFFMALLLGHSLLSFYLAAEHDGLSHDGSIFERTRSLSFGSLLNFIMWNMPFHAEHHAYPCIPWYALPKLSEVLKQDIIHKESNLLLLHKNNFRALINKNQTKQS